MWPPKSLHHCILTQFGAFGHKHKTGAKIKKKTSARSFSNKVRTAGAAVLFAARAAARSPRPLVRETNVMEGFNFLKSQLAIKPRMCGSRY